MVFTTPAWAPHLPCDPPDSIPLHQFQFDEEHGRCPFRSARNPFTSALSGATIPVLDVKQRIDYLARGLAKRMGWKPNIGSEWDKVASIFSLNHVSPVH
jgi:ribosome assembly protein SQT1